MSCSPSIPRTGLLPGNLIDWRSALGTHYLRLGCASRHRRFMSAMPDRSVRIIAERASPDIVLGIEDDGRVVGVLEIFKGNDDHAEIAISVEDAYQGRGYGKALFVDGLAAADRAGVRTADLYFASENRGIRSLVRSAGGKIVRLGAECEAHIDVSRCNAARGSTINEPEFQKSTMALRGCAPIQCPARFPSATSLPQKCWSEDERTIR